MPAEEGILVVTTNFFHGSQLIHKGDTVRAGHPFTELYAKYLRPLEIDYDYEEPSRSRHAKPKTGPIKFVDSPPPSKK